jgi:hypothetical protein
MSGWRASGTLLLLLLGCGETTHNDPASSGGDATGGAATSGSAAVGGPTGGNGTGGTASTGSELGGKGGVETTHPEPVAGAAPADAEAGSDSGGGVGPCGGIDARCEPGEQACDPVLGKLGTCDACGVVTDVDEAGVDCVRLLASDKESNGVCAVLGSNRLECWPDAFEMQKTTLPANIIEVLLPDDYPFGAQNRNPCLRDVTNGYSCGLQVCDGPVVVGDNSMCGLCSGQLICRDLIADPPAVPRPIDISLTDGYVFVLSPLGVHAFGETYQLPAWQGAPAHLLVDHRFGGCAISDQDEMACWLTLSNGLQPASWQGHFKKVIGSTLPRACALDDSRQLRCGNVFEDATPAPYGDADTIDFVASSSIVCSLSVEGHVKCWNDATGEPRNVAPGW